MTTNWNYIATISDGESFEIDGINIWNKEWKSTGEKTTVKDPIYKQDHLISVYNIIVNNKTIEFAAGEFSNEIFGIYQRD